MPIKVARSAGFCFGVQRAVDMVFDALDRGEKICTLGPIIHNQQLVDQLARQGVNSIGRVSDNIDGKKVIIRSHGVAPSVYEELRASGCQYLDATCPFVAKIHRIVAEHRGEDAVTLIAGDENHPEVQAIVGHCGSRVLLFQTAEEAEEKLKNFPNCDRFSFLLVAQTTFHAKEWENCVKTIKKVCTKLKIFDTICSATALRQNEARQLAAWADKMIVVGGRHSSNTGKLRAICEQICPTVLVETADELKAEDFAGISNLGVTAGASTPACIIKEVQKTMSEILTDELSFEEMLDLSFKSTYTGEKVTAVVTSVAPNEVAVDIGTKHAGYVPLSELTDDPSAKTEDLVKKGDQLELIVLRVNDVEGTVMLSKKRLDAIAGFEKVMDAVDSGEVLEGVVTEVVKGGVLALTNGVKVFIPASQATNSRNDNLEDLLKKPVQFKILEVNRQRRRAVGSIKAVLKDQRKALEEEFWKEVEIGKVYQGTVKSLTDYGAFIDLGGIDGMVHISELSWSKIKHPSQVVKVGDLVEVYVKDIDPEKKKISLGYKKNEDNPWEILKKNYEIGSVVEVKIVSLTAFGAFAQIIPGVDGLIHISQISNERINKPADVLSVGQVVTAKITDIDFEKKRISLSIKALLQKDEPAEESAPEAEAAEEPSENE